LEKSDYIWLDGEFMPWESATIHVVTHTLHYGLGVFEGIRAYATPKGPAIFRLQEHMVRLMGSCKIAGLKVPYTQAQLEEAILELVRKNRHDACYIRPLVFLGGERMGIYNRGITVRVALVTWGWGAYLGEDGLEKGIRACVSSYTRHHPNVNMTKAKICGNYVNSQFAKVEAIDGGFQEALMLDPEGYVAEGTGENIFIVEGGQLYTPPLDNALHGITRDTVMTLARDEGISCMGIRITRDRVLLADEVFLVGTAAEITPVREVDRRPIGEGCRGPVTKLLQDRYFAIVRGEDERHAEWLTVV
jgi:branched-chain amino acid aminotransferase